MQPPPLIFPSCCLIDLVPKIQGKKRALTGLPSRFQVPWANCGEGRKGLLHESLGPLLYSAICIFPARGAKTQPTPTCQKRGCHDVQYPIPSCPIFAFQPLHLAGDYASDSARGLSISTANWRFHVMHMKPSILQSFKLRLLSRDWATAPWLLSLVESSICLSYAAVTPESKETRVQKSISP